MRRASRSPHSLLTGTIAVGLLLLLALQAVEAERSAGRSVGILLSIEEAGLVIEEVTPDGPAERAGVLPGDRLISIDGQQVEDFEEYDEIAHDFRRGAPATYRVVREGRELVLQVRPGMPFPWSDFVFNFPVALTHLALGLLAFAQRPRDLRARLLAFLSFAVALELALPVELVGSPTLSAAVDLLFIVLTGTQMGLELHLASMIPEPRGWLRRRPWLVSVFYLLGLGFTAPAFVAYVAESWTGVALPWTLDQGLFLLLSIGLPLWAIGVLLLLGQAALNHPEPTGRQQAGLVFIGTLPWAALVIATMVLELMALPITDWVTQVETLALLCYPVAAFVAIFRYHLFDLELVVRRSLIYGTLTAALVLVFYAVVGLGGAFLSSRTAGGSVWAVAGATLLMGLLFSPLKEKVQQWIDSHFFRERAALRRDLVALASRLPSHGHLPAMGRELVERLCEVLHVDSATFLLADPDAEILTTLAHEGPGGSDSQPVLLSLDDAGVRLLLDARRPLKPHQLRDAGSRIEQGMRRIDVQLLVPVLHDDLLVGVLLLGPKSSGEEYPLEEIELLSLLGHHVASVFENARLFESATRDSLTGLLRREAALDELHREVRRALRFGRSLTLAMADLDHFKEVNDRHGHLTGDLLLRRVADTLTAGLRSTDIVGRFGGEEFLVVFPEADMVGAIQGAEKVREMVAASFVEIDDGARIATTVSIGLAGLGEVEGDTPGERSEALIAAADRRLYEAKAAGRNRVVPSSLDAARRAAEAGRFKPSS